MTLEGVVVEAYAGIPVPYANVYFDDLHLGGLTDELGRFRFPGVPIGARRLNATGIGYEPFHDSVLVARGMAPLRIRLVSAQRDEAAQRRDSVWVFRRDSLTALGRWPPRLDPRLRDALEGATRVRVYRLDNQHPIAHDSIGDSSRFVGRWRIVRDGPLMSRTAWKRFVDVLADTLLYQAPALGLSRCGELAPAYAVRAWSPEGLIELSVDFRCAGFLIRGPDRLEQSGTFAGTRNAFRELGRSAFPSDQAFQGHFEIGFE